MYDKLQSICFAFIACKFILGNIYEIEMGNCLLVISREIIRYIVIEMMIYQIYQMHTNLSYNIMEYLSKCWIENMCCVC